MTPKQYDDGEAQHFADAFFINGNSLKDGKLKLELNINMPVRVDKNNIVIDRPMMAEILTHELMHAYRKKKELEAGHYKWSFPGLEYIKSKFNKGKKNKYTMTQRMMSYIRTIPNPKTDEKMIEKFKWIGYTMVEDEMYANIAGIETFLVVGGDIKNSRGKQQVDIINEYLNTIEKNASINDWEKCMKDFSYIQVRKNETVDRFKKRWIAYYKDRIAKFYEKVEKLENKYKEKNI